MLIMYSLAIVALLVSTAAGYMTLIEVFPVELLYYQYFLRKPIVWLIFIGTIIWILWTTFQTSVFPVWTLLPLALMGFAVVAANKLHQSHMFQAVDFPLISKDPFALPLKDNMQLAVVEYGDVTKAYPLDYVIHHHIINDQFGNRIVSLTYCAMCRSIIAFDVTDIGPLFVASFKHANMIVADRRTKTFFQQASFESIIGKLHPRTLTMIPFQILSWSNLKTLIPLPQVVQITKRDLREFDLPLPVSWKKIMASESTPGLSSSRRDKTFPARTHVVGIYDRRLQKEVVYIKSEIINHGIVHNEALDIYLVATDNTVNGFFGHLEGVSLDLSLISENRLSDAYTKTVWNVRGKRLEGTHRLDLEPIALSDEYLFSWKQFHPDSVLVRV